MRLLLLLLPLGLFAGYSNEYQQCLNDVERYIVEVEYVNGDIDLDLGSESTDYWLSMETERRCDIRIGKENKFDPNPQTREMPLNVQAVFYQGLLIILVIVLIAIFRK